MINSNYSFFSNSEIFKKLSNFLGTRSTRQCRSHFQKLMNRFKIPIKAIKAKKTISNPNQRLVKKFEIPNQKYHII